MDKAGVSAKLAAWITECATISDDAEALLHGVCESLLREAGIPLWRVSVSGPAIDPTYRSVGLTWFADRGVAISFTPHEQDRSVWLRSPIVALIESGERAIRYRLDGDCDVLAFPILQELREQGGTDYILHVIAFAPGLALRGIALSFATRRPEGFDAAAVAAFEAIVPTLGLALARMSLAHTLRDVLGTYIGPGTATEVLEGNIRRGQGRTVSAAILLVDLHGFTALSDRADPLDVVVWLNEHFDALGDPVAELGGEILKFLGDGFLAAFTVPDASQHPCTVCRRALTAATRAIAANDALNARRAAAGKPELSADVVLHFGEVVYGNVGTGQRLDFTLIGRAVNEASRIEGHCQSLGHPLLISDAFAGRCDNALREVGTVPLRGLSTPLRLWTLPERSPDAATAQ